MNYILLTSVSLSKILNHHFIHVEKFWKSAHTPKIIQLFMKYISNLR